MSYQPSDIISLRAALKLSQDELAEMVGVDRSNVSRWERGETKPSGAARKLLMTIAAKAARRPRQASAGVAA